MFSRTRVSWHEWHAATALLLWVTAGTAAEYVQKRHRGVTRGNDWLDTVLPLLLFLSLCCCCVAGRLCAYRHSFARNEVHETVARDTPMYVSNLGVLALLVLVAVLSTLRGDADDPHSENRHLVRSWAPAFVVGISAYVLWLVYLVAARCTSDPYRRTYAFLYGCCRDAPHHRGDVVPVLTVEDSDIPPYFIGSASDAGARRAAGTVAVAAYGVTMYGAAFAGLASLVLLYRHLEHHASHAPSLNTALVAALLVGVASLARGIHYFVLRRRRLAANPLAADAPTLYDVLYMGTAALVAAFVAWFLVVLPALEPHAAHVTFAPLYTALFLAILVSLLGGCVSPPPRRAPVAPV